MRVTYRRSDGSCNARTVRIARVLMERTMTMLECEDIETQEVRGVRLDRVETAVLHEES